MDAAKTYRIVASGVTSVWLDQRGVVDALYCFRSSRCEDRGDLPVRFPKLQINGEALQRIDDDFTLKYAAGYVR